MSPGGELVESQFIAIPETTERVSLLNSKLLEDVPRYEGTYAFEVPRSVQAICERIHEVGGHAFVVGGSVRDAVMVQEFDNYSHPPKDFDLEVFGLEPNTLEQLLTDLPSVRYVNSEGKAFCVFKATVEDATLPLDVAIARSERPDAIEKHKSVVTGQPYATVPQAAQRRDLTIGALYYDPLDRSLYDPYEGVTAIQNKTLEIVNAETFVEDPARVLRVMQFAGRFGFTASPETIAVCSRMVAEGALNPLPRDRNIAEFDKLFSGSSQVVKGLEAAEQMGVLAWYWPSLRPAQVDFSAVARLDENLSQTRIDEKALLRITATHRALGGNAETLSLFLNKLLLSGMDKKIIRAQDAGHRFMLHATDNEDAAYIARKAAYTVGKVERPLSETMLLANAFATEEQIEQIERVREAAQHLEILENSLEIFATGEDIMPYFDGKGGPWIGEVFDEVLEEHFRGNIRSRAEALLALEKIVSVFKKGQ